jgi:hypothetical protein
MQIQISQQTRAKMQAMAERTDRAQTRVGHFELLALEQAAAQALQGYASKSENYREIQTATRTSQPRVAQWWAGYNGARGKVTAADLYDFPVRVVSEALGIKTPTTEGEKVKGKSFAQLVADLRQVWQAGGERKALLQRAAFSVANGAGFFITKGGSKAPQTPLVKAIEYAVNRTAERMSVKQSRVLDLETDVQVIPEFLEVGESAHFEGGDRLTGFGALMIDGQLIERVRTWNTAKPVFTVKLERLEWYDIKEAAEALRDGYELVYTRNGAKCRAPSDVVAKIEEAMYKKFVYRLDVPRDVVEVWNGFVALLKAAPVWALGGLFGLIPAMVAKFTERQDGYMAWQNDRAASASAKGHQIVFTESEKAAEAPLGLLPAIAALAGQKRREEISAQKLERIRQVAARADALIAKYA